MIVVGALVRWKAAGSAARATWEVRRRDGRYVWLRDIHSGAEQVAFEGDCVFVGRVADRLKGDLIDWLYPWTSWVEQPHSDRIFVRKGRELFVAELAGGCWSIPGRPRTTVNSWTPITL